MKKCAKCGIIKPASEFPKNKGHKDGLESTCRACLKEYNRVYRLANRERILEVNRQWKARNKERHRAGSRAWIENNPERAKETARRWVKNNPEKIKAAAKRWAKRHPEKVRANTRITGARLRATPSGRLKRNMGTMMCLALNGRKAGRHWETLVGYKIEDLKRHIESRFRQGMTWGNYGRGGWEVDHILPVASFDFDHEEEIKKCWALNNLQPLWSYENKSKGKRIQPRKGLRGDS